MASDWAKWLVTFETFDIALFGTLFTTDKISVRILHYGIVAEEIHSGVYSVEDAKKPVYMKAGRFGSDNAAFRLHEIL